MNKDFFMMFDCRVYNAISSEPSFVLILLHVISIPLTGKVTVVSSVVFPSLI